MFHPHFNLIHFATLNVRRLSTRERLVELQEALKRTFLDILAVTELRWRGTGSIELEESDYKFFYAGPEDAQGPSGTGFFVSQRILPFVDAFARENDRMSRLDVRFDDNLYRFLSVYLPPSSSSPTTEDEEFSTYVEMIQAVISKSESKNTSLPCARNPEMGKETSDALKIHSVILGDFNANLGRKMDDTESSLGRHTYDSYRNSRGQILVEFCEELRLRAIATFFKTRNGRKWTWRSPNGRTYSCIDHIFACRHLRFKSIRTGSIQFETDHRLLRGVLQMDKCDARVRKHPRLKSRLDHDVYRMELARICPQKLRGLPNSYQEICEYIKKAASVAVRPSETRQYLSTGTLSLMRQRQHMKKEMNSSTDRLAYTETCKLLRRMIRNDIRTHHCNLVQKAIESCGSLRMIQNKMSIGRRQPHQLHDKRGKLCHSRNEIKEVIREYYGQLYASHSPVTYTPWEKDEDDCPLFFPQ